MPFIKACGITSTEDALAACAAGFTALGFVFAESPRRVTPETARHICERLPASVLRVGVFVEPEDREVKSITRFCDLDLVQIHAKDPAPLARRLGMRAIPCIRPRSADELAAIDEFGHPFAVLIDTWHPRRAGGTGITGDWELASLAAARARVILAGGLDPRNVRQAVAKVHPFGVDVSSGVEKEAGSKDVRLLEEFARNAWQALLADFLTGRSGKGAGPARL